MTVKEHILNEINHLDDKQLYEIEKMWELKIL